MKESKKTIGVTYLEWKRKHGKVKELVCTWKGGNWTCFLAPTLHLHISPEGAKQFHDENYFVAALFFGSLPILSAVTTFATTTQRGPFRVHKNLLLFEMASNS